MAKKSKAKSAPKPFFHAGSAYFIRTVTHHFVGRCVRVEGPLVILVDAAWIADNGRFNVAMATGKFSEVEPYPPYVEVAVNTGSMIDARAWDKPLPIGVK